MEASDIPKKVLEAADGSFIVFGDIIQHGHSFNDWDLRITKTNSVGEVLFDTTMVREDYQDAAEGMSRTSDGNFVAVAFRGAPYALNDIHLIKFTPECKIIWDKIMGGKVTGPIEELIQAPDNSILIAGQGNYAPAYNDFRKAVVTRISQEGDSIFTRYYMTNYGDSRGSSIAPLNNNDYALTGWVIIRGEVRTYLIVDTFIPCSLPSIDLGKDSTVCEGEKLKLDGGEGFLSYLWNNKTAGRFLEVDTPGTYFVKAYGNFKYCYKTDTITISFKDCTPPPVDPCSVMIKQKIKEIPNVITPNDDGINDVFEMDIAFLGCELNIANRWGKEIYSTNYYQNNWNATNISNGTYFYSLRKKSDCGELIDCKGYLIIFR